MIIKKIECLTSRHYINFSLEISIDKLIVFIGDNGSGKSNLAAAISGEAQKVLNNVPWQRDAIEVHVSQLDDDAREEILPEHLTDNFVFKEQWIQSIKFPKKPLLYSNSYKRNVVFISLDDLLGRKGVANIVDIDNYIKDFLFSDINYIDGALKFPKLDMLSDFGKAIGFFNIAKLIEIIKINANLESSGKVSLLIEQGFFSSAEKIIAYIFAMTVQKKPKILILDDVDAVLHPRMKSNFNIILNEIRKINPHGMQIFIFTNSSTTFEYLDKTSTEVYITKRIGDKFTIEREINGCQHYSTAKLRYEIFGIVNDDYFIELYQLIEDNLKYEGCTTGKITVKSVDDFLLKKNAALYDGPGSGNYKTMICNARNHIHHKTDSERIISREDIESGIIFMKEIILQP